MEQDIIIHIFERSDGDYEYDFYDRYSEDAQTEDIPSEWFEGGVCTGTIEDTVNMVADSMQARLLKMRANGQIK